MNVNGSRFHMLLDKKDWGRCAVPGDTLGAPPRMLADLWRAEEEAGGTPAAVAWDQDRAHLRLHDDRSQPYPFEQGEVPIAPEARRPADADRYGNVYWIGDDRRSLRVRSAGDRREASFWPDGAAEGMGAGGHRRGDFAAAAPAAPVGRTFHALAVTEDHYLVVACSEAAGSGLLVFDLMAGGPPLDLPWRGAEPLAALDMARRHCGGVWLLERGGRVREFDRRLAVVGTAAAPDGEAAAAPLFGPVGGPPRPPAATVPPAAIDVAQLVGSPVDAVAVEALPDDGLLILDRGSFEPDRPRPRILRLVRDAGGMAAAGAWELNERPHDLVVGTAVLPGGQVKPPLLFVAPAAARAARAYRLPPDAGPFVLQEVGEPFPLRRFGGRSLLTIRGAASYDSGGETLLWVPIVRQERARHAPEGELTTPVFDSREPQCVWDRVMLDACIPGGASVDIEARAADERVPAGGGSPATGESDVLVAAWKPQPRACLRADGPELPWLRGPRATAASTGTGTWELLLQGIRGRYLQLRVRLGGDGAATPRIRALRVWFPRFSYPQRFLPAVYRQDPVAGDFLERFLANFEGINTAIEDRIAQAQVLFDPRTAPVETLEWLADWFDLALDPSWDEHRRRLFIRHAMDFFQWRGTVHGLRMVLALALEPVVRDTLFDDPDGACGCPQRIRIVEAYLTRRVGALAAGDSPAALADRLQAFALFPPEPAADDPDASASWRSVCEANLGFVPAAGADERARWQAFLRSRHGPIGAVRDAHGADYAAFEAIDLPRDWPGRSEAAEDWADFVRPGAGMLPRARWQGFLAARYHRIRLLNDAYGTSWPSFDVVALPDHLPETAAALTDWLQFERRLLAMAGTAHRFSVLLPVTDSREDPDILRRRLELARRVVELEKPAHTVFDVRFYWALHRLGEARLGLDTLLDVGSRAPDLLPDAVLGRSYLGASFVGGPQQPPDGDRRLLEC